MVGRKKIVIGVGAVVFVVLCLWVKSRWNAWFGNPPEPPYVALRAPGRVLLTFGRTAGERKVSWTCDSVPSGDAFVLLALDGDTVRVEADGEMFRSRNGQAAYYNARLTALKPDRTYAYQACNGLRRTPWYRFQTHGGRTRGDFSFLYMGDVQDTVGGRSGGDLSRALLRYPKAEFMVFGGDFVERPMDVAWGEAFRQLDTVATSLPILSVTGNHDYLKHVVRRLDHRFPLVFSNYMDSQIGGNQVYTLRYNDLQLFFLDSNRELPFLLRQRAWLDRELAASTARWRVVVVHHPLFSVKGRRNNLVQRWVFNPVVERHQVDLLLQGHEHAYARQTTQGGTPVRLISHCSPKHYRIRNAGDFDVVDTLSRYYQAVRLHGDTLQVVTHDAPSGSVIDAFSIIKAGEAEARVEEGV